MKKGIILLFCVIMSWGFFSLQVLAAEGDVETFTSEKVPGATCTCFPDWWETCTGDVAKRKYKCTTWAGVVGFQLVFAKMIRYVVNIVLLLGVLAVAGVGIAWTFAGGDDIKLKTTIKGWAINIVVGVIILFMFAYILKFLAPWVYV